MLECDYLVVGTGASGMAFADAVISESPDRTLIMIDKLPKPGGHWNHAYDFCKLHQPAKYYGVASEKLERRHKDSSAAYSDLSSKREILDYYRDVLDKLIKTGRVKHFGECTYQYEDKKDKEKNETTTEEPSFVLHSFKDKEGRSHTVKVKRRLVDTTYQNIQIPSTHKPSYEVHPDVNFIPINGLSNLSASDTANKPFVVVGSGKTGIDAILYLLNDLDVPPDHITWIMPRDAWLYNRDFFLPETLLLRFHLWLNGDSTTLEESLLAQETNGVVMRLDPTIMPTKSSCATINEDELQQLRKIQNIIRKGRVSSITLTHLVMTNFQKEKVPYPTGSIVVDCSANGLPPQQAVPVFQPHKIVLQPLDACIICLSAASAGYVECHPQFSDDADRNDLLMPVPYPNTPEQMLESELQFFRNNFMGIASDPRTAWWYQNCRLLITSHASVWTLVQGFAGKIYFGFRGIPKAIDAKIVQYRNINNEDFPHKVYDKTGLTKVILMTGIITIFFWSVVVGGLVLMGILGSKVFSS